MNIVKLQNELKSVPDDALIGYVQNPTGQVPSYLALSELQRRKEMRDKYQTQQAPETSVAEDLAAPKPQGIAAIPQQAAAPVAEPGVAGLPVPDTMFNEKAMAAGGIVAFDDGGYVNPSLYGGPVQEYEPWYKSMKLFGTKYNLYGDGVLGPTPDQNYAVELHYYFYPQSIVTAGTTWLGDNFDSALLYGSLVEAYTFMKGEQDMMILYDTKYKEALALLKNLGDGKQRGDAYRDGQIKLPVS